MVKWKIFTSLYSAILYAYVSVQIEVVDVLFIILSLLYFCMVIRIYFIKEMFQIISSLFFSTAAISIIGGMFAYWYWGFLLGLFLMFISLFIIIGHYSFSNRL